MSRSLSSVTQHTVFTIKLTCSMLACLSDRLAKYFMYFVIKVQFEVNFLTLEAFEIKALIHWI